MAKELPDINTFLNRLAQQFDDSPSESLTPKTLFRDLPGWTSLQSLVVVISFDDEYGVTIGADELRQAETLADLYHLIKDKQVV